MKFGKVHMNGSAEIVEHRAIILFWGCVYTKKSKIDRKWNIMIIKY